MGAEYLYVDLPSVDANYGAGSGRAKHDGVDPSSFSVVRCHG